ncbi:MAG: glycosyltransferase [Flavobacteriales bacterium]|nr:glycosyltransferase [Flavobacteriales bacterium]
MTGSLKSPSLLPRVSVVVPTYQHAAFIEQCIQGILMQQTTFPVEILIGEDESTDGTREICQRLAEEHPDLIRLFPRSRKDVIYINGKPTGRANFLHLLRECRGKYIALCEGDDHWTEPSKLQQQVDALEADPEAAACFTNAWNQHGGERTEYLDGTYTKIPGPRVEQHELVNAQGMPTCTFVCRAERLFPLPEVLQRTPTADTILYAHLSNFGHFIYLPRITAVRHMHPGGIHSLTSVANRLLVTLRSLPYMDQVSHGKQHGVIAARELYEARAGWAVCLKEPHPELAKRCWRILARRRREAGWNLTTTARNYLKAYWPKTERAMGRHWVRLLGR